MSVVVFSHGIHGMLGCVIGSVGMAGCHTLLICAHPCLSVGGTSLPEGSVCSACSVGHSLCLLCWCCRGSCTSVVVFSHRFHGFPQIVRLRYWQRGYGRMPYPPNLCASVPICGRHFSARMFCVFCVFCGNTLPVCFVGNVVVFSHGIHRMLGCVIGGVGMAGMPYPPNLCASVPICGRHFSARRFCVFCVFCVFCGTLSLFALLVLQRQLHQRGSILPQISRISTDS